MILRIVLISFVFVFRLSAQQLYFPIHIETTSNIERNLILSGKMEHTSFKPLLSSQIQKSFDADSSVFGYYKTINDSIRENKSWFVRKLFYEDLIYIDTTDFFLAINPMVNFQSGYSRDDTSRLFVNTRGIMVRGNIGSDLSFYSDFSENQAFFPEYMREYIISKRVIPGQGRYKGFKDYGYDFSNVSGYLSYTPANWLNFHLGHSKNFIGEGYRSLLLSDFSYNYPFIKTSLTFKRVQYINMLTSHQEISAYDTRLLAYQRKHGSYNFLNIIINKYLQIGFLEAVVWKSTLKTMNNYFNLNYINPVIFSRSLYYGLNDNNNILLGFQGKASLFNHLILYGQYVLDNNSKSLTEKKSGYQLGLKLYDLLNIKNLFIQSEFNKVAPYTYSHVNILQSYSNANEPLGHPLGANFRELYSTVRYSYKDFIIGFRYTIAETGLNYGSNNFGSDILISDTLAFYNTVDPALGDKGLMTDIQHIKVNLAYVINKKTNLQIFAEIDQRRLINKISDTKNTYIFFGIRSSFNNQYYDF